MDIIQLYRDYNVPYVTEGHKHARPGWVNISCPFCTGEHFGYHLGYDSVDNKFVCWRCGGSGKWASNVISTLLKVSKSEAKNILRQYGALTGKAPEKKRKIKIKAFKLPSNTTELLNKYKAYLSNRGFDADKLIELYKLQSIGVIGKLDEINYKHRIIIPYFWDSKMVSFDSRDITNRSQNKYMACPDDRELVARKSILYGLQDKWKDIGICVEGATDVWRMGENSFAVSGIKYTSKQVREIVKQFKKVFVIFDDESQAIEQAKKLVKELKFRGVEAHRITIKGDPGGLAQDEADYLVKQLIK